jgi:hypothetical protein
MESTEGRVCKKKGGMDRQRGWGLEKGNGKKGLRWRRKPRGVKEAGRSDGSGRRKGRLGWMGRKMEFGKSTLSKVAVPVPFKGEAKRRKREREGEGEGGS